MKSKLACGNASAAPRVQPWLLRLRHALPWLRVRREPRQLRLCESLSLGEKRIVAVIQYQNVKFLVGGGAGSLHLLARLGETQSFAELLTEWCERQP